jgi:hypothetical protein
MEYDENETQDETDKSSESPAFVISGETIGDIFADMYNSEYDQDPNLDDTVEKVRNLKLSAVISGDDWSIVNSDDVNLG